MGDPCPKCGYVPPSDPDEMPAKECTKCHETWPADEEFFRRQPKPNNPDRLAPWCKACEVENRIRHG